MIISLVFLCGTAFGVFLVVAGLTILAIRQNGNNDRAYKNVPEWRDDSSHEDWRR